MKKELLIITIGLLFIGCHYNKSTEIQEEQPDIILPPEVEFNVLVDSSVLSNDSLFFFLDFYGLPSVMFNNVIIDILNDTTENDFRIVIDTLLAQSICCFPSGKLFTVSQNRLRQFIDNQMQDVVELPSKNMHIEKAGESSLYIYGQIIADKDTVNMLYLYNTYTQEVSALLKDKRIIVAMAGNGDSTYIALENSLFLLANGKSEELLSDISIKSIAVLNNKCFVATNDFVGVFCGTNEFIPFINKGAKKLLCNGYELYILFNNGMLAELTNIHSFDDFCIKIDSLLTQNQAISN
ncbi:MAG: hypothetical protein LBI15_04875 [Dysgonamonadaceae bacterium]|jgi:hypothetical protein|nr:hypothetical protein [Dysgonamonadaceae bacterium]